MNTLYGVVRVSTVAAACAFSVVLLTGCSSGSAQGPQSAAASAQDSVAAGVLVDVRTPEEFAQGHLEGAVNIPVESADFAAQVQALGSPSVQVYCRSGNRSAQAVALLAGSGVNAADLGGFAQAEQATGLPVVR